MNPMRTIFCLLLTAYFLQLSAFGQTLEADWAARVNGELIPMAEFVRASEMIKNQLISSGEITLEAAEGEEALRLSQRSVLDQLIEGALIRQNAALAGIEVSSTEVRAKIEEVKNGFPSSREFHKSLAEQGITVDELKKGIRQGLLSEKITKTLMAQLQVSTEEASIFYQRNLDLFVQPERIRLSQILVGTKEAAEEVQRKVRAGQVVEMEDLGYVERGSLKPELEEIAFFLKPGKISPIIETAEGFYIFRVEEKIPPKETKFEEAKNSIEKFILEEKGRTAFSDWLKEQRAKASIEIHESLKKIVED